jgi:hypothetical protein
VEGPVSKVDFVSEALPYAGRLGWNVLPLPAGQKLPHIPKARGGNGVHDASADPVQIRAWGAHCLDCNIGIACGQASGIVVVDVEVARALAGSVDPNTRLYIEGRARINEYQGKDGQRRVGLAVTAWKAERLAIGRSRRPKRSHRWRMTKHHRQHRSIVGP